MTTLALAGDTMLGRGVAEHLATHSVRTLFDEQLLEIVASADAMLLNLECCISERGDRWPGRVFHFRAPPVAVEALTLLGVRCVNLANNHALDYGVTALLDTLDVLATAGIAVAGAGVDQAAARAPVLLDVGRTQLAVVGFADHPVEYAAGPRRPGIAYADIRDATPAWLTDTVSALASSAAHVVVSPHWGPNMTSMPRPYVRRTAADLIDAGATLVAGHSAHLFHGVAGQVMYDLGDFVDDYATNPVLRNDLGLLWLVSFGDAGITEMEAVPLHIGFCHTTLADGDDAAWVGRRLRQACRELGTDVTEQAGRLVIRFNLVREQEAQP